MHIDLSRLRGEKPYEEKQIVFSFSLDLSDVRLWGEEVFREPVQVTGTLKRRAEVVTVDYSTACTLHTHCARCLEPLARSQVCQFSHTIVEKVAQEPSADERIVAPQGILDMSELATSDILLQQDSVVLCTADCCGLCPKCGANLNFGQCGCSAHEPDPRFDALRKLLDEQKQ